MIAAPGSDHRLLFVDPGGETDWDTGMANPLWLMTAERGPPALLSVVGMFGAPA